MDKHQINIEVKINHFFAYNDTHKIQINRDEIKDNFDELSKKLNREEVQSFAKNNFRFSNEVNNNDVSKRIEHMERQIKNVISISKLIGNFYFKRIYHDNIEKRIMFVHAYFSTKLRKSSLSFHDYLECSERCFFVEQFLLQQRGNQDKRDYHLGKIRIFHLVSISDNNITIIPLFVDSNHQIVSGGVIPLDKIINIVDNIITLEKKYEPSFTIQNLYDKYPELKKETWKITNPHLFCKGIVDYIRRIIKK